jgi:hypothetical protein
MVKDNVTGLIWEMKTSKDAVKNYTDPHDADNTYTWYDSNPATNGGDPVAPCASNGLYKWDGTAWAQLIGSDPTKMAILN